MSNDPSFGDSYLNKMQREADLPIYRRRDRHLQAQVVVRMPVELRDQAEAFAKTNDRTLAQEIRRALRMYLEQFDGGV